MLLIAASALQWSDICAPPARVRSVRVFELFGYIPASPVRPTDSRMLLRSLERVTATFRLVITPVFQKSRTLLGCADHGPTPKNWRQGLLVSSSGYPPPVVRLSSRGPQLSSAPSFCPPKLPSTKSNSP